MLATGFWIRQGRYSTCEHGRLEKLHQFVNLDQHIDRHLKLGTRDVRLLFINLQGKPLTRSARDCRPAHRPEQEGTKKM